MPSGLTPVDMERLTGDKGRPFEIEDPVDNVADFAEPAERVEVCHARIGGGVVPRPDYPRATAFTRIPRDAYSIASERVTAAKPPLVRAGSAAGILLSA